MTRVRKRASVHPRTVSEFSRDTRPRLTKSTRGTTKNSPVTTTKVDIRVWKTALELAGGDRKRIEVISATEVIVH